MSSTSCQIGPKKHFRCCSVPLWAFKYHLKQILRVAKQGIVVFSRKEKRLPEGFIRERCALMRDL